MNYPHKRPVFQLNWPNQTKEKSVNPTPNVTSLGDGTTSDGRMGFSELSKIIQVNDEDNIKPIYPFVGIYGSVRVLGKCAHCMHLMYAKPKPIKPENKDGGRMLAFCPFCRKQFYYGVDPYGRADFEVKKELETGGVEMMTNAPTPSEMSDMGSITHDPSHINGGGY